MAAGKRRIIVGIVGRIPGSTLAIAWRNSITLWATPAAADVVMMADPVYAQDRETSQNKGKPRCG
jgi:hypothetical protein